MATERKQNLKIITEAQRKEKAIELYLSGSSMAAIAKDLEVSIGTVHNDITGLIKASIARAEDLAAVYVGEQLRRTEELYLALMPGIAKGSPRSVEVALKVLDRQARLLGTDKPEKADINQTNIITVEYVELAQDKIASPSYQPEEGTEGS